MGDHFEVDEISVVTGLGQEIAGFAADVDGYSYSPNLDTVASGSDGSKIKKAASGGDSLIASAQSAISYNMRQFDAVCQLAGEGYDQTEQDVKGHFKTVGSALDHGDE